MLPTLALAVALPFLASGSAPAPDEAADPRPGVTPDRDLACEIPLRWRIGEVDERFGLAEDEAARAVRQAGMLWETATGRVLMFQESADGIPVHFIFDERQRMTLERQEREAEIAEMARELTEAQRDLDRLSSDLERTRSMYRTRSATYEERLAGYDELVSYWNGRGGAPPEEVARLRTIEQELDLYRERANEAAAEVNQLVDRVNTSTEALNRAIGQLNDARTELQSDFPRMTVESAHYRDERTGLGRLTLSRDRSIQVFQYEDRDHLLLVIAHELGHALGLEHSGVEGALMAESAVASPGQGTPAVHPADIEQLRELCPELF